MILNTFIIFWLILFLIFTRLAFSQKSLKTYITGALTSLIYFLIVTEALVYVFHHKIPVIGFMVNPFPGTYRPLILNLRYHSPYFLVALIVEFLVYLKLNATIRKSLARPLQGMVLPKV